MVDLDPEVIARLKQFKSLTQLYNYNALKSRKRDFFLISGIKSRNTSFAI
jgi:hypothetical protein